MHRISGQRELQRDRVAFMVPVPTFAIVLISSTVSITETPSFRRFVWRWCTHEQHRAVMRLFAFYADFAT